MAGMLFEYGAFRRAIPQLAFLAILASPSAAVAQGMNSEPTDTAGNRPQPAYDPIGIRYGGLTIWPQLSIASGYDSNVFARNRNVIADGSVTLTPSLRIDRSRPRSSLSLSTDARIRRYADLTEQDDEQYRADLRGDFDISDRTQLAGHIGWAQSTVQRGTSENSLQVGEPLKTTTLVADFRLSQRLNRFSINATAAASRFRYADIKINDEVSIDQSFRNGRTLNGTLSLSYDVAPHFALVLRGTAGDFKYQDKRPDGNRDATDLGVTIGGRYELTELLVAELTAGIREHNFRNAEFADVSGLALNGRLRWYPTRLLSLRFDLGQRVSTSTFDSVTAVTITSATFDADYELRRNFILSAGAAATHERYSGVEGTSGSFAVNGRFKWKANRWLQLGGSLGFERRTRSVALIAPQYNAVRGLFTVTLAR